MSLDDIKKRAQEILDIVNGMLPPPPEEIIVTPSNYKEKLRNISNVSFTEFDNYVRVSASAVRLELPCTYQNVEISCKARIVEEGSNQNYLLQLYGRGGHHSTNYPCDGSAYKGRFRRTSATIVKEVEHPCYTENRSEIRREMYESIVGRWCEYKVVIFNSPDNSVVTAAYLDDQAKAMYKDVGEWATSSTAFKDNCPALQFGNNGFRQRDEILNKAGSLVAFRSDGGTIWEFEYLKARKL